MLTSELLRYQIQNGQIFAIYVNPNSEKYLKIAQDIIDIYVAYLGKTRGELTAALEEYEAYDPDYRVKRGLAKILEDKAKFEFNCEMEPELLREQIFEYSGANHPIVTEASLTHTVTQKEAIESLSKKLGISCQQIVNGMYADLKENHVMTEFPLNKGGQGVVLNPPSSEWLLNRYNVALAQAMLYRANELRIRIYRNRKPKASVSEANHKTKSLVNEVNIPTKYKLVFKFIKFFRLMHVVSGNNQDGYHIILDGPASIFRLSQKYGIQMALFLPALLHCNRWWMEADIVMNNQTNHTFKLTDEFGLKSHYKDPGEFDSELERAFAKKFEETETEWTLERETDIIDLKDTVMIPDFAFVHPDGRRAMMEIVGFWTPDYLRKKLDKLRRAGRPNMVIAVSEKLNCSADDFVDIPGEVMFFKYRINVHEVIERVERCALSNCPDDVT
jgi:predicted nuclease of restriction endonuclease-like RecB superfamily